MTPECCTHWDWGCVVSLIGGFVDRLIDWLIDWFVGVVDWLIGGVVWLVVEWLIVWNQAHNSGYQAVQLFQP